MYGKSNKEKTKARKIFQGENFEVACYLFSLVVFNRNDIPSKGTFW